jgi:hypothetical protein
MLTGITLRENVALYRRSGGVVYVTETQVNYTEERYCSCRSVFWDQ